MIILPGILVAAAAALALNGSYLVQHAGLSGLPAVRASRPVATVRALLHSRMWVLGALLGYGGLVLNVIALGLAPLSLVQSVVAAGLVVVALAAACARRRAPGVREVGAIGLIVVALAGLGIGAQPVASGVPSPLVLLVFEGFAALVAWGIVRGRRAAAADRLGLAAGVLYGATNVALASVLASGGPATTAVAVATGVAVTAGGFFAFQRGLQSGPPLGVVTLMTAGTNVVAILGGLIVMRDALGATAGIAVLHAACFALVVLAGVLAATELTRLDAAARARETPTSPAPPTACSAVLDQAA